jgi:hypothetical protein
MKDDEAPLPLRPRTRPTTMEWFNEGIALEAAPAAPDTDTESFDEEPPQRRRRIGATVAAVLVLAGLGLLVRSRLTAAATVSAPPAIADRR